MKEGKNLPSIYGYRLRGYGNCFLSSNNFGSNPNNCTIEMECDGSISAPMRSWPFCSFGE